MEFSAQEPLEICDFTEKVVHCQEMSDDAATAINTYISNGGSVWFLNDPCLTPDSTTSVNRTTVLGPGQSTTINSSTQSL